MSSPYEIVYREAFSFPLPPRQMWQELERPDRLTGRWRWVDVRRVDPTLEQGAELTCVIKPPVPFRMLLDVVVLEVTHDELIGVEFRGDLRGRGELRLAPDGEGTLAEVSWRVEMMQRGMRAAARHTHPLLRWAHDRIVEAAVRSFRRHVERWPSRGES
jgi:hypothetical protein